MNKSIFVSSTFKDFQVERELILKTIEKEINEALFNKNIKVNFVDLRWGIDTEEGGLKKVITFCIDYVNQSKPYIIIMLGDSYGSLVTKDLLEPIYNINKLKYDGLLKSVKNLLSRPNLLLSPLSGRIEARVEKIAFLILLGKKFHLLAKLIAIYLS